MVKSSLAALVALSSLLCPSPWAQAQEGVLSAPTFDGLPGGLRIPFAQAFEPNTIGVTVGGTLFDQKNFDGSGSNATGGAAGIGIGYTFSSRFALGFNVTAVGLNAPTILRDPLQSGVTRLSLMVLPWTARNRDMVFRGLALRVGGRFTSGRVFVDGWLPTASPFTDLIASFRTGLISFHTLAGYLQDRSEGLLALDNFIPEPDVDGGTTPLDPARRFVYGISEGSQIRWGLGINAPLASGRVRPFLEYRGKTYMGVSAGDDPHIVGVGVRVALPFAGRMLAIGLSGDYAFSGTAPTSLHPREPELSAALQLAIVSPPYRVKTVVREIRVPVETVRPECPDFGSVRGVVRDTESGEPLRLALVIFENTDRNALLSNRFGQFQAFAFPAGPVQVTARKKGYGNATAEITVEKNKTAELQIDLLPADSSIALVRGTIRSRKGDPIASTITLEAPNVEPTVLTGDEQGRFSVNMQPGDYQVTVSAEGFTTKTKTVTVTAGQLLILNLLLSEEGSK